jgi:hypothetical protein
MKQKDWTQKMKEQLADYQVEPAGDLWADIEARIDMPVATNRPLWPLRLRRMGIAAAVALLVAGGAYLLWTQTDDDPTSAQPVVSEVNEPMKQDTVGTKQPESQQLLAATEVCKPTRAVTAEPATSIIKDVEEPVVAASAESSESNTAEPSETKTTAQTEKTEKTEKTVRHTDVPESNTQLLADASDWTEHRRRQHTSPRVTLGYYAGGSTGSVSSISPVLMSEEKKRKFDPDYAGSRGMRNVMREPVYLLNYSESEHHGVPVSFGLSVGYSLGSRWSVNTGVVYTSLSSEYTSQVRSNVLQRKQHLGYVGIPLALRFRIWSIGNLSFYATTGLQVDINVLAEFDNGNDTQRLKGVKPQYSGQLSAGIQYDVFRRVGIYAEGGGRYYFDNGGELRSYFTEHPMGVNLQAGLRLGF